MEHFITFGNLETSVAIEGATAAFLQTGYQTVAFTDMKAGAEIPLHEDEQESIDIVLEGELEMQVGAARAILTRGMMSFVPPRTSHCAKALTDCKVVTVIHPRREL